MQAELAETHTLVIVVDELDRCLPDYAIKILERLHHLFADVNGTILILRSDSHSGEESRNIVIY